ncbi:MAG: tetraacyldisaccharide 4'-kinase [Bacteroidetes bacterium]|nr:tetraacyldisaccharide 4'-kinase [Bacteroidota bacterium]
MTPFGFVWKILFLPLTFLYGFLSFTKNLLFDSGILKPKKVSVPVISIGNLTAGGTGKTPITAFIAQLLIDEGKQVGIVSRGYGRQTKGTVWVCREGKLLVSSDEGGDEPVELALWVPGLSIVVSESRFDAATELLRLVKVDVILVDDGFQHRQFHRDIDILVQDLQSWISNRFQLPSGRFRESWKHAKSADALIWTKGSTILKEKAEKLGTGYLPLNTFLAERKKVQPVFQGTQNRYDFAGKKAVAFCGIGLPDIFFSDAESVGLALVSRKSFPDHHVYSDSDLSGLSRELTESAADFFLTTLKDSCRLNATPAGKAFRESNRVAVLPYELVPAETEKFRSWLLASLKKSTSPK